MNHPSSHGRGPLALGSETKKDKISCIGTISYSTGNLKLIMQEIKLAYKVAYTAA